jgi:hypothetical protein
MKRLWKWINRDGLLHLETCALIVLAFSLFLPWWIAGLVSLAAGIGKEIWDRKHGVCDWHDVVCDLIGVVIGIVLTVI